MNSIFVIPGSLSVVCRRYRRIAMAAMGVYCLAVFAISGWLGWQPPTSGFGLYLAAISPALPIGVAIYALGRSIAAEPDEFRRMIYVKLMLISTGLTLFTCTAWGFLAQYGHVWAPPLYFACIAWFGFFAVATPIVNWRYR
jgi:hypothetical protein